MMNIVCLTGCGIDAEVLYEFGFTTKPPVVRAQLMGPIRVYPTNATSCKSLNDGPYKSTVDCELRV